MHLHFRGFRHFRLADGRLLYHTVSIRTSMGKTNPTCRQLVQQWVDKYDPYKRALRRQHQEPFDEMMSYAFTDATAGNAMNAPNPNEPILISICLEQQLRIENLQERVEELGSGVKD